MLVDLNQKFVNTDGRVVKDISIIEDDDGVQTRVTKDLILERIVSLALTEPVDQKMSGDNRIRCFELLLRVISHKDGVVELETDDVSYIKTLIKPKFKVLVVGEAMRMLEGKDIGIEIIDEIPIADQDETKPKLEPGMSVEELVDPPEGIEPEKPDLPLPKPEPEKIEPEPEPEKPEPEEAKQSSV